jgi:hypothetical protein
MIKKIEKKNHAVKCSSCGRWLNSEHPKEYYKETATKTSWTVWFFSEAIEKGWVWVPDTTDNQISCLYVPMGETVYQSKGKDYCPACAWERGLLRYNEYLDSAYFADVRKTVFERDHYQCRKCGSAKNLEPHHISYRNLGFKDREVDDLLTLCNKCHAELHKYDVKAANEM